MRGAISSAPPQRHCGGDENPAQGLSLVRSHHDEGDHPHIHMMAWSESQQAYLSREGIGADQVAAHQRYFQAGTAAVYEQKSESQMSWCASAGGSAELTRQMQTGICITEVEGRCSSFASAGFRHRQKVLRLSPKPIKKIVDEIVDQMERLRSCPTL
jgi:hypothetical protein